MQRRLQKQDKDPKWAQALKSELRDNAENFLLESNLANGAEKEAAEYIKDDNNSKPHNYFRLTNHSDVQTYPR